MTEITIQQASALFAALTIIAVAFAVGEIVRRKSARRKGKQSIYDEWARMERTYSKRNTR